MKILVYPHGLHIGGSQIIAVELAAAVRDMGHEVLISAPDGSLAELIARRRLRLVPLPTPTGPRPSMRAIRFLRALVRNESVDVVHAYERTACLEAYFGAHVLERIPVVGTSMAMSLPRPYPTSTPFIVGTRTLEERVRQSRSGAVHLMEPPIDTEENSPAVPASDFRAAYEVSDADSLIVMVSRLANLVKLEGLQNCIQATETLAEQLPVRLIVVGGGEAYDPLWRHADGVNKRLGRRTVILTGPMIDPRPAYAAADVVVGMGSSVLRGMAFAKPAVVVGEQGFSEVVTPETVDRFLSEGFYGTGDGDASSQRLVQQLSALLQDEPRRAALGRFSRQLVCERFSSKAAAEMLQQLYRDCAGATPSYGTLIPESMRMGSWILGSKVKQRLLHAWRSARARSSSSEAGRGLTS